MNYLFAWFKSTKSLIADLRNRDALVSQYRRKLDACNQLNEFHQHRMDEVKAELKQAQALGSEKDVILKSLSEENNRLAVLLSEKTQERNRYRERLSSVIKGEFLPILDQVKTIHQFVEQKLENL